MEKYGSKAEFLSMSKSTIADRLRIFYCEAAPKKVEVRGKTQAPLQEYHKNSLRNIRAALNRHFHDLYLDLDIVRDKEFIYANRALDGTLKDQTKRGVARATEHKKVINSTDMEKISTYLSKGYASSPIILRQAMWFTVSLHFVTRGMEFHHQLLTNSFEIKTDENGDEFACLTHEFLQKNFQGGLSSEEAPKDRRMYAIPNAELCPVKILRFYLSRLDPQCTHLFNHCNKEAMLSPSDKDVWYTQKPLSQRGFGNFMRDIAKSSNCVENYTPHCLRATAIQLMNDAGHEARHIMFMSGHRSEASIRSYNREFSTKQKKELSMTLAGAATSTGKATVPALPQPFPQPSATCIRPTETGDFVDQRQLALPEHSSQNRSQNDNRQYNMSQFLSTSGLMGRSNFQNCTFNFNM